MSASMSPALASNAEVIAPVVPLSGIENAVFSRIDFVEVIGQKLIVYGWVIGLHSPIQSAWINLGGVAIDLMKRTIPVPRPDVARHFGLDQGNDRHGFYALVDLPARFSQVDDLKLEVTLASGVTNESTWPVTCHDAPAASVMEPQLTTLNRLLPSLPRTEAERLVEFVKPSLGLHVEELYLPALPPPAQFGIDLCCVLENRILVVAGWRLDPVDDIVMAKLRIGDRAFHFLEDSVSSARPDIHPDLSLYRKNKAAVLPGFIFVREIQPLEPREDSAFFIFTTGNAAVQLTHPICHIPHEARCDLLSLLEKMESDSALVLIENITNTLRCCPEQHSLGTLLELMQNRAIEHLPASIQQTSPRYSLHIDLAIPVADKGLYLIGWFNAAPNCQIQVCCHHGTSSVVISDNWNRHARTDVSLHLASAGILTPHHNHGFSCYVPFSESDGRCYLSASSETGEVRRMRVPISEPPESALTTVRSLLTSFSSEHPELSLLLNTHLGPAVGTAWAARNKSTRMPIIRNYGPKLPDPELSMIVPLYGRHDFAAYQLALFADDLAFQNIELIYVVDDPSILAEFTRACAGLYGVYQVPFVLASSGVNLGFAGANNFGAGISHGKHLLFLNSDVLPRRPGWAGELLRIYQSVPVPGALGAKLLYEDGSVQHAGMAFRRYPDWGNLWINDHPYKGQDPFGLDGVHEVDAVTAACVFIEASRFREMGGFCEDYIIGDFEDSDLCLRLLSAGRRNYIGLDVELYHLERQSQNRLDDVLRTNLTLYNCWLHNSRWEKFIDSRTSLDFLRPVSAV